MRKLSKLTMLIIILFSIISYSASFGADKHLDIPRVLVIRSLDHVRFDMRTIMSGFQSAIETRELQVDIIDVDSKYLDDLEYTNGITTMIRSMIENGGDYDLLIIIREPAVQYALQLEELLTETPVVFGMVENPQLASGIHDMYEAVQVNEPVLLRENILLAQTVNENVERVSVVLDESMAGSSIEKALYGQKSLFSSDMEIEIYTSEDIFMDRVSLSNNDINNSMVYFLSGYHSDNIFEDVNVGNGIVLTPWTNLIESKVDGGRVIDSRRYGEIIGSHAVEILEGTSPSNLEQINVNSSYVFNYGNVYNKRMDLQWIENEVIYIGGEEISDSNGLVTIGIILLLFSAVVVIVLMIQHYVAHHQNMPTTASPFAEEIVLNVDTAISIKNEERRYIHVNEKFKRMFNIKGDVIGMADSDIFPAVFATELKSIDDRATFGSDDYDKKIIYNHMESGALFLEFKVKKVKDHQGRIHLVSYIGDLTEQKKHEKTLAELNKLLEQQVRDRTGELIQAEKMAILGTLVAGVSHEISTPIGVSITASTFLTDQTNHLKRQFEDGALKKSDMVSFLEMLDETGRKFFLTT